MNTIKNIPVFKPLIEQDEINACTEVLKLGWLGMGSYVNDFEESIRKFLNTDRYVAAVNTGHSALHLGLIIAEVGKDNEVITPSFNNIADFQAILAVGAKPVFCDIDKNTLCINLHKAEKLITSNTKAIIVMDYGCVLCDHNKVSKFASKYKLRIIHDAAHSFGSKYKGKMIGSFSDICIFSFDPVKNITCIDGGALIVKTKEELEKIHELRLIGMNQPSDVMYKNQRVWTYNVRQLGFRYHMANLHAAIGLIQLKKIDRITKTRRFTCNYYNKNLNKIPEIILPKTEFNDITPFLYYIRVDSHDRDELRKYLLEHGVDTGIHWQPGHQFDLLKNFNKGDLSVTNKICKEIISLPLHSCMSMNDMNKVVSTILSFYETKT